MTSAFNILQCLACGGGLADEQRRLRCRECHRLFSSGDGYVDLLPSALTGTVAAAQATCWNADAEADEVCAAASVPKSRSETIFVKIPPLLRELDLEGRVLVDLGCGYGRTLLHATASGRPRAAIGIDVSQVMLRKARGYAASLGLEPILVRAPADRLPLRDGCADVVYSSAVMLHLPKPIVADALHEVWRILRPTGEAVLEQCFPGWWNPDGLQTKAVTILGRARLRAAWVRTYTRRELERLVASTGPWSEVRIEPESRRIMPTIVGTKPLGPLKSCARHVNALASRRLSTRSVFVTSWSVRLVR